MANRESWDCDSGARDLSPEPYNLQKLIENAVKSVTSGDGGQIDGQHFLNLANTLHLAALTSLKGEITELNERLKQVTDDKDILANKLSKSKLDRGRIVHECKDKLEQQSQRFEERVTELHSVIAELQKKSDRSNNSNAFQSIQEEDENALLEEKEGTSVSNESVDNKTESEDQYDYEPENGLPWVDDSNILCANSEQVANESSYTDSMDNSMAAKLNTDSTKLKGKILELEHEVEAAHEDNDKLVKKLRQTQHDLHRIRAYAQQLKTEREKMLKKKMPKSLGSSAEELLSNSKSPTPPGSESDSTSISGMIEYDVELERLRSKIDNLQSQNDLLIATLEESKANANHLTMLVGKYESNNTALRLAMEYADQVIEALEILLLLEETDDDILMASIHGGDQVNDLTQRMKRAHENKKAAENVAKSLLLSLDRSCGAVNQATNPSVSPWEDLSSHSRTSTTSSTTSSCDSEFNKLDKTRLKEYANQLKQERAAIRLTTVELESIPVNMESLMPILPISKMQHWDMENIVLMQELTALKEEKAELRSRLYLMEKEKRQVETQLNSQTAQKQAYIVQIDHLKSRETYNDCIAGATPVITLENLKSTGAGELPKDIAEAMEREKKLKIHVHELSTALEQLTNNTETHNQQSSDFVNDLKRANNALVAAYEKAKRKHSSRLKKLETQIKAMCDRHETSTRMLKQRIALLEDENLHLSKKKHTETSL